MKLQLIKCMISTLKYLSTSPANVSAFSVTLH